MVQHQQVSGQWLSQLESAPTFFPTVDEFTDPIAYIRSIQTEGSKHGAYAAHTSSSALRSDYGPYEPFWCAGICKIVPPVVPTVPSGLVRRLYICRLQGDPYLLHQYLELQTCRCLKRLTAASSISRPGSKWCSNFVGKLWTQLVFMTVASKYAGQSCATLLRFLASQHGLLAGPTPSRTMRSLQTNFNGVDLVWQGACLPRWWRSACKQSANFILHPSACPWHDQAVVCRQTIGARCLAVTIPLLSMAMMWKAQHSVLQMLMTLLAAAAGTCRQDYRMCPVTHHTAVLGLNCLAICMHHADYVNAGTAFTCLYHACLCKYSCCLDGCWASTSPQLDPLIRNLSCLTQHLQAVLHIALEGFH